MPADKALIPRASAIARPPDPTPDPTPRLRLLRKASAPEKSFGGTRMAT